MEDSPFIGYVGDPDFHDGSVLTVKQVGDSLQVRVRGASGKFYVVEFGGVSAVRSNKPEGMVLYALSELRMQPPQRRFVFANWDEQDEASLEIDAESFTVRF